MDQLEALAKAAKITVVIADGIARCRAMTPILGFAALADDAFAVR